MNEAKSLARVWPAARGRALPPLVQPIAYLLLIAGSVAFVAPFFWMVRTSLMSVSDVFVYPPMFFPVPPRWENYAEMWHTGPTLNWIMNSVTVTSIAVVGEVVTSLLAAFGFARTRFPGRGVALALALATLMIPYQVVLIPRFLMFRTLGWINTLYPLIVPELFGSAFSIFILHQFFMSLPTEMDEAATMDGANLFTILWRIDAPLCGPAIATVAVFAFIKHWNDFIQPLIYLQTPTMLTLAVGIRWFTTGNGTEFHLLMAISVLAILPILAVFFLAQKYFVQGIALTGLKG